MRDRSLLWPVATSMCDRDLVTLFPQVVNGARTWSIRPGASPDDLVVEEQHGRLPELMAKALGVDKMRVIEAGGTPSRPSARR